MKSRDASFRSDGVRLAALVHFGDASRRRPAVVMCSGFQGLKELIPGKLWQPFVDAGFVCVSFDYRGFGTSGGERGRVIPAEQVSDVRNAISFAQQQPEIDPNAIALLGWGLGGGIAIQAAAEDERVIAVASLNGVGDAGRAVRTSGGERHWNEMVDKIAVDRVARRAGRSELVTPWDVVPLDPVTRANVDFDMYGHHARFASDGVSLESAEAYYGFQPEQSVARISPRPLLIVHGVLNELHQVEEARSIYARAGEPKTLIEIPKAHHLDWIQPGNDLYAEFVPKVVNWFASL